MLEPQHGDRLEQRLLGVDIFRLVAFVAVVMLHARGGLLPASTTEAISLVTRFGVPFFFLVPGFFLARKHVAPVAYSTALFLRLMVPYLVWVGFYILAHYAIFGNTQIGGLRRLVFEGGPGYHLWFLPSLWLSASLFVFMRAFLGLRWAVVASIVLYVVGLYFVELQHAAPFSWNFRDGPFFGCIYVAIGYCIGTSRFRLTSLAATSLSIFGLVLQICERILLDRIAGIDLSTPIDFFVGTVPFATGLFLLSLNVHFETKVVHVIAALGRKTLGLYAIHAVFLWMVQEYILPSTIGHVAEAATIAVVASLAAVTAVSKIRFLQPLIE